MTTRLSAVEYEELFDRLHEGIFIIREGKMVFTNAALGTLLGEDPAAVVGRPFTALVAPEDLPMVLDRYKRRLAGEDVPDTYEFSMMHGDGVTRVPIFMHARLTTIGGETVSIGSLVPLALRSTVERSIAETQAVQGPGEEAERLAIPVLPIQEHMLVVPLVGHVNAARARVFMERALAEVSARRARELIVDITGVPIVDARVAGYLVRTAAAVRLLGARMTIAGVSPAVARALVEVGVDLGSLHTTGSLQDACRAAAGRSPDAT